MAKDLELSEVDAYIMELKSSLYVNCSKEIENSELTHKQIAKLVGTSRARISRLSKMGENNVSLEMLIKIIATLIEKPPLKIAV